MIKVFAIFTFFLCLPAKAEILGFCFPKKVRLSSVQKYLQPFLLADERMDLIGIRHCVEVEAKSHRKSLIDKFLTIKYPINKRYGLGTSLSPVKTFESNPARCPLELIKTESVAKQTDTFGVGRKSDLRRQNQRSRSVSRSHLLLSSGRQGRLRVNDVDLLVTCSVRGNSRYQLNFSLSSRKNAVSTSVSLSRGIKIDLGSIIEDLKNKSSDLSLRDGIHLSKTKGKSKTRFELSIK